MTTCAINKWNDFITELPHQRLPFSKKNWGNQNHSLCSYQGKLKPAIAYHLVKTFLPQGGTLLDPFSGVGTIPFEGALNNILSYGIDISPLAYIVSSAKVYKCDKYKCDKYLNDMTVFLNSNAVPDEYKKVNALFGYNKTLSEYYHPDTFNEILLARMFIATYPPKSPEEMLVVACLLHILHGNRPYALSRKSHPIVPYAPTGIFEYKNLITKVSEKMKKSLEALPETGFINGKMFLADSTLKWPYELNNLDAIITSPPFYDSTRFYLANWIRLWFIGWNRKDFDTEPHKYIDERQKKDFYVYNPIFKQAKERLKDGGYFVMHLGKSKKCNMGEILQYIGKKWFQHTELYVEDVRNCEKFGIKDLGTVTDHQYLLMY